jgi:HlyD family secretion protein
MKKKKKLLFWIIGILVLAVALFVVFGGSGKDEGIKVSVDKVARRDIIEVVSASGKIFPEIEVK